MKDEGWDLWQHGCSESCRTSDVWLAVFYQQVASSMTVSMDVTLSVRRYWLRVNLAARR